MIILSYFVLLWLANTLNFGISLMLWVTASLKLFSRKILQHELYKYSVQSSSNWVFRSTSLYKKITKVARAIYAGLARSCNLLFNPVFLLGLLRFASTNCPWVSEPEDAQKQNYSIIPGFKENCEKRFQHLC